MAFIIEYAALCNKGLVRDKNQDNLWCDDVYLDSVNDGLEEILEGINDTLTLPAFAVFDGMGGEQQGEMAAYIAASSFDKILNKNEKAETKVFLLNACVEMNNKICDYQAKNHIRTMGTTAAILMCGTDSIYVCNVGDSRIYQYSGKTITKITQDHVEQGEMNKKTPLTQNLGISEEEFIIEPYVAKGEYRNGDCLLICSDGLTDMVSDKQITDVFKEKMSMSETAEKLMDMSLSNGGVDNITIIACKVCKPRNQRSYYNSKKRY